MPEDILARLGQKMKKARKNRHMTQQKLSDASGIAVRTISKIERGLMNPSFEVLAAQVSVLGTSFDSLFTSCDGGETEGVQELVGLYRLCPANKQRLILDIIRVIAHTPMNDN